MGMVEKRVNPNLQGDRVPQPPPNGCDDVYPTRPGGDMRADNAPPHSNRLQMMLGSCLGRVLYVCPPCAGNSAVGAVGTAPAAAAADALSPEAAVQLAHEAGPEHLADMLGGRRLVIKCVGQHHCVHGTRGGCGR